MNDWKCAITLASCCGICLTIAASASADFVSVTTVIKDDPDTEFLCTQGHGISVPGPLTVCNVYAVFDNPDNELLNVGNAELQVYNGVDPDVFFQHPEGNGATSPECADIRRDPDLICDTFVTIGLECVPQFPSTDGTTTDPNFDPIEFQFNGHVVGGWFNGDPLNDQGHASAYPDLQVLFLRSSVAQGSSLSGDIDIFWWDEHHGDVFADIDVPIECVAACGSCPTDSDGDGGTDAADLAVLLGSWGPCAPGEPCECLDNDASGSIDAFDLGVLLGAWGPCP